MNFNKLAKKMENVPATPEQKRFAENKKLVQKWNEEKSAGRISMPAMVPNVTLGVTLKGNFLISVKSSFEIKDGLRELGFKFDGAEKSWFGTTENFDRVIEITNKLQKTLNVQLGGGVAK